MSAFAMEAGPDPLLGKVLQDRYRVVRKLGEGGMGAVYEGEHLVIKKRVAIKVLHPQFAASADIVARFHQEALAATAIGHEHIVEVNDMGRTPEGAIFMVLEFLTGTDFAGLLEKERRLSVGRVVHIVSQVCAGVQAAHDKGIVHRDLKPENVYLIRRGADPEFAKVLDFGISKFQDGAETGGARASTKTGSVLGTAYYMSPEQAQGKKTVDHRTDVWAIGVILFKALTGRYPFDDDAYPMLIMKICTESPPPVRTLRPDIPEALAAVIDRCMVRDVSRRVQSCRELEALLAPFAGIDAPPPAWNEMAFASTIASGDAVTPAMPTPPRESTVERTDLTATGIRSRAPAPRWLPMAGVAVIASALAGGGVWLSEQSSDVATVEPVPPPALPEAQPETVPVPAPAEEIEFIVSPSEAVVLIDSHPVPAGSDGRVVRAVDPNDTVVHELRIEARGFRTRVENIRLSYEQRVVVSLEPGIGMDDRTHTAPPPAPATGRHPRSSATPTEPTTTAPTPSSAETEPPHVAEPEPVRTEPEAPPETPLLDGVIAPPPRAGLKRLVIP